METASPPIAITARATAQIKQILAQEASGAMLRIAVLGGGCSGFQYNFSIDDTITNDDATITHDGVCVLVDNVSATYLRGAQLDWVDELIGASFQIRNPNATASCGCGTSFTL